MSEPDGGRYGCSWAGPEGASRARHKSLAVVELIYKTAAGMTCRGSIGPLLIGTHVSPFRKCQYLLRGVVKMDKGTK